MPDLYDLHDLDHVAGRSRCDLHGPAPAFSGWIRDYADPAPHNLITAA